MKRARRYHGSCERCDKPFSAAQPTARFCSDQCRIRAAYARYAAARGPAQPPGPIGPDYEVDPLTGCWNWLKFKDRHGYGHKNLPRAEGGKPVLAHRWVYEQLRGPIPDGASLDHLCRNPSCVNPDHLEPVTHTENVRRGAKAKLSVSTAAAIRASSDSQKALAARYGVHRSTINAVIHGRTWKAV